MNSLKSAIAEHPFLRGMKREYFEILAKNARETAFDQGQIIFHEGEPAYQFYLITQGKVAVESHPPLGRDIPLQILAGGDVLGWSWLFPPFNWHFPARALEPTEAIFLDGASLLVACQNDHQLGYELMKRIAQVVIDRLQSARRCLLEGQREDRPFAVVDLKPPARRDHQIASAKTMEDMLAEHPFFKGLSERHLRILADSAMPSEFPADQIIFGEGEIANRFYLIQRGKVVIEVPEAERGAVPIQVIADGDVLGWSWLFPPYYWYFDARALQPSRAIFFYGTRLREQCEADHEFGYELLKRACQVLIQRLQATRRQLLAARIADKPHSAVA